MVLLFLTHRGVRVCSKIVNYSIDVNLTKDFLNSATIQVALDVSSKECIFDVDLTSVYRRC